MTGSASRATHSMLHRASISIRVECPPGACSCDREQLLVDPAADQRPLLLTREQELQLIARIERVDSHADLKKVQALIHRNLGAQLIIAPGPREVRTVRGIVIRLEDQPGLCRKVRQSVPAAVRRMLDARPEIAWAILDADGLFGA